MSQPGQEAPVEQPTEGAPEGAPVETSEQDPPGSEHLGDPGKRALETMKAERKAARDEAASHKARADALQAERDGKQAEHAAELEKQRVQGEALAMANQRILKAELRAAAAGKLADPADALKFLDLDAFEVDADGEVDMSAVTAAVEELLKSKPYLAAQGGGRFQGGADGGARNEPPSKSIQEQIVEAEKSRDFRTAIRLRQELAAQMAAAK